MFYGSDSHPVLRTLSESSLKSAVWPSKRCAEPTSVLIITSSMHVKNNTYMYYFKRIMENVVP